MATLKYMGKAPGDVPFYGNVTKSMYRVSSRDRFVEVDDRDAAGLLSLVEGGKVVFQRSTLPVTHVTPVPEQRTAEGTPSGDTEDSKPDPTATTEPDKTDDSDVVFDFTVLSGIGAKRNEVLHTAGITTPAAFQAMTDERSEELIGVSGKSLAIWKAKLERLVTEA